MGNEIQNNRARIENKKLYVLFNENWKEVKLDEYEDISIISAGANAVTVSGVHKRTERKDCIKIYTPNRNSGRKDVSINQYLKEVRKLATLNETHIVTIYGAFDIDDDIHVVSMEYIDGITLKEWLAKKNKRNPEQDYIDRLNIAEEILKVVLFYQEKGIIHGDLHLNNILVDKSNGIHIIDFGTSLFAKEGQSQGRESFFIYNLARQIMGDEFDEKFFNLKCPHKVKDKIKYSNDVRCKYPILVTRTMLAYVKTKDLALQLPQTTLIASDIVNLCVELTDGIYIDFDYAIKSLWAKEINKKIDIDTVAAIIGDNIDVHVIPENMENFPKILGTLSEDLLETYYQMTILTKDKWDWARVKKNTFSKYKNFFSSEEFDAIMRTIQEAEDNTYFEFMCSDTTYNRKEDDNNKVVMSEALIDYYGDLKFLQELWVNVSERRWKRELDAIMH